jgi:hypothetical protein
MQVDTWSDEEVDEALASLEQIATNQETYELATIERHKESVGELRVTDHLINAHIFLMCLLIGYLVSVHFAPTAREIGGD